MMNQSMSSHNMMQNRSNNNTSGMMNNYNNNNRFSSSHSSGNLGLMNRSSSTRNMSSAVQSNMARLMGGNTNNSNSMGSSSMLSNLGNQSQKTSNAFMAMMGQQQQQQQQQNQSNSNLMNMNRSSSNNTSSLSGNKRSISATDLHALVANKSMRSATNATARKSAKSAATMTTDSLFHNSCKLYPKTLVVLESALAFDPQAIRRPVPLLVGGDDENTSSKEGSNSAAVKEESGETQNADQKMTDGATAKDSQDGDATGDGTEAKAEESPAIKQEKASGEMTETKQPKEDNKENKVIKKVYRSDEWYSYPFNIAMKHGAGLDVLQFLAKEGPDVLAQPDGDEEACSLGIALGMDEPSLDVVRLLLAANPSTRKVVDRRGNTPLHMAARVIVADPMLSLDIVSLVFSANNDAIHERNFRGETPLDVAIRSPFANDQVVDFLQEKIAPETTIFVEEAPIPC